MLPSIACGQQPVVTDATEPGPDLTPEQVIAIQLNALKNNDRPATDHGIRITFNFASPGNKASTGPLATFRRKKEKLRGGWVQSANFASECARKLLIF